MRLHRKRREVRLQRLIGPPSGFSYGNRARACTLNGKESQIMQSDGAQDGP